MPPPDEAMPPPATAKGWRERPPRNIRNILVVRRHNHIGDMLCSVPMYAALKREWPGASVTLVAARTMYPIPLRVLNPYIDEVIVHEKSSVRGQIAFYRRVRAKNFDIAIVPSTIAVSRTAHLVAFASGAPVRAGIAALDGVRNPSARLLTRTCTARWAAERVHQTDRNLQIAGLLDCDIQDEAIFAPPIRRTLESDREAAAFLAAFAGDRKFPPVGLHAGAGKIANLWPTERFAELATRISTRHAVSFLLTAGDLDREVVDRLSGLLEQQGIPYRVLTNGQLPFQAAVFARLSCYVTNDTGAMHIAAAAGARVVSLFGPTPAWEWAPRAPGSIALQSPTGAIGDISVGDVEAAVEQVLFRPVRPE